MDQQTRTTGTYIAAVLLFFLAFMFFCMGVVLLFAFPHVLFYVGIVLLVFSGVFVYSGKRNLNDAKQIQADATRQLRTAVSPRESLQQDAQKNVSAANRSHSDIVIHVRWQYSDAEWKRFLKWEQGTRKLSSTVEAILIIALGSLLLRGMRGASWSTALLLSGAMAVIYWLGKYYFSMKSFGIGKRNEVVVTNRSVIINGKVNSFSDGLYWLEKVELKTEKELNVIQFVYGWNTRKGPSVEELRIPVPDNKLEEAKRLVSLY